MRRRTLVMGSPAAVASLSIVTAACGGAGSSQAAVEPTAVVGITPSPAAFQIQAQVRPQEARFGQDENVVVQARFMSREGRPVAGGQLSALVNYPAGPKTLTAEITTFQDGRVDLNIPVAPAARGSNVRVELTMRYQGQEYRSATGFTVR